jgi:hypothetical protein
MKNNLEEWQRGNESKLTSIERLMIHTEWLKQQHKEVRQRIQSKVKPEEKPIVGFVKD